MQTRIRKGQDRNLFSYIKGTLEEYWEDTIVVESGGIGWNIHVPLSVLDLSLIHISLHQRKLEKMKSFKKSLLEKLFVQ